MSSAKYKMDMCHGPLWGKIFRFSMPLLLANVLGLLFYAADLIVLGKFASSEAVAAVGASGGPVLLCLTLFYGLATGVNVLAARNIGAKNYQQLTKVVHSSMAMALYGGLVMTVLGLFCAKPLLRLLATPEEVFDSALRYVCICNLGIPAVVVYNFGASIMRAAGDTRRPLIYMVVAGVVNVLLNLFFVLVCKLDVAGVAIATKLSNLLSAVLVVQALRRSSDAGMKLYWHKLKIDIASFKEIIYIGFPAGIQGALFSIANMTIQSSINSLGWRAVAGNTAALNIESVVYLASTSFASAAISFVGQNHGGKKYKRIVRSIYICLICSSAAAIITGWSSLLFPRELLGLYTDDAEAISYGVIRMKILLSVYFLCGIMDVICGALRGLGQSIMPTIVTLLGICALRVLWVFMIFPLSPTMNNLMFSYPVSWLAVIAVNGWLLYKVCVDMMRGAVRERNILYRQKNNRGVVL